MVPRKEAMPTQASGLLDTLKRVQLAGYQQDGSVEIFHLRWPYINGLDYVTLDEALEARWIEVTIVNEPRPSSSPLTS